MKPEVEKTIARLASGPEFARNPCFYLYDADDIEAKLGLLSQRPGNVSLYYAMKANPNKEILGAMRASPTVKGIEIASCGELDKACEVFDASQLLFTGPAKTQYELEKSVSAGIRLINVESLVEAARIQSIAQRYGRVVNILLRINTNYHLDGALANMTGVSTKMGIEQDRIIDALAEVEKMDRLRVLGFHVFAASGVMDYSLLLNYVNYVFDLVNDIEQSTHKQAEIIDFGGGFGVDYSSQAQAFNTKAYFSGLDKLVDEHGFANKELVLELGRYVVGESGYYVAEIIDIKESKGHKHLVAAGGVNHLRLPSASGVLQPVYILPMNRPSLISAQPFAHDELVDIGGPLCFAEDKLAWDTHVPHAEIGDLVVVGQAGAYGYTVSSLELLSHPRPPEYLVHCGEPIG